MSTPETGGSSINHMAQNPELTISIVNTSNVSLLRDCLKSIFENTKKTTLEIIVVDNASTDGSVDMVQQEFPSVKVIINPERKGYGDSHNRAIEAASGNFILIFNEDMIVLPGALDTMVDIVERDANIGALGCKLLNPDGTLQHSCFRFPSLLRKFFDEFVPMNLFFRKSPWRGKMYDWDHNQEREVDIVMGCCMLIPGKVFHEVGNFDPQFFVYSEEDDLCRRIKNQGYKILFTPAAEIIHFGGQTSKTMSVKMHLVQTESKIKYWKKHHGNFKAKIFALLTGLGAFMRLPGWLGYWLFSRKKRDLAKNMMIKYSRTLTFLLRRPQETFNEHKKYL